MKQLFIILLAISISFPAAFSNNRQQTKTLTISELKKEFSTLREENVRNTGNSVIRFETLTRPSFGIKNIVKPVKTTTAASKIKTTVNDYFKLDSLIDFTTGDIPGIIYKETFEYDNQQRLIKSGYFERDTINNTWKTESLESIEYSSEGLLVRRQQESWNNTLDTTEISYLEEYTYNENGDILLYEQYMLSWNIYTNAYVFAGSYKNEYTYDSNGNETGSVYYDWNMVQMEWEPASKTESTFEDGRELMFATYMWDSETNKWVGHFKLEHDWMAVIEQMSSVYYHWDTESDTWVASNSSIYEISGEGSNMVVTLINSELDYESMELIPSSKTVLSQVARQPYNDPDSYGLLLRYYWDAATGAWEPTEKVVNVFDSFNNLIDKQESGTLYNSQTDEYDWSLRRQTTYTFNTEGNHSEKLIVEYDFDYTTETIVVSAKWKNTYSYDIAGLLTENLEQYWDVSTSAWINYSRSTFSYTANGLLSVETEYGSYSTENAEWIPSMKTEHFYNPDNSEGGRSGYEWDTETSAWVNTFIEENYKDAKGRETLTSYSYRNSYADEMIQNLQETSYDENDNIIMTRYIYTEMNWNGEGFDILINGEKAEYNYDASTPAAMESETYYSYSASDKSWKPESKTIFTHDRSVTYPMLILPFENNDSEFMSLYFRYKINDLTSYNWDTISSEWKSDIKTILYYTPHQLTSITDNTSAVSVIYPNPTAGEIFVDLNIGESAVIELYDLQGRKLVSNVVSHNRPLDVSNLEVGTYFYRIVAESGIFRGKILKQ